MSQLIEIKVPDIGDYQDVPVIEVLVKVGDKVEKEQSIVVLESDKATMDIPSSHSGVVKEIKVKAGDNLSQGSVVMTIEEGAVEMHRHQPVCRLRQQHHLHLHLQPLSHPSKRLQLLPPLVILQQLSM
jgi:pyruvate/2-oxoglutarate dehydrogenase complex dihydrolipoamide acyltransferase (E2) component